MIRKFLLGVLAGALCFTVAAPVGAKPTDDLVVSLQRGGYIIYMRHGPTDKSERHKEQSMLRSGEFRLDDCATQRNLTDEGRDRVREAGAAFRWLHIPIGRVLASRFCRTVETARLFRGEEPTPADDLTPDPATGEPGRAEALRARLQEQPPPGTNTLIVAHGGIMAALVGVQPNEGEALVYRPEAGPEFPRLVGTIKLQEWATIAGPLP